MQQTPNARSQSQAELRESEGMMMGLVGQRRQLVAEIEDLQERKVDLIDKLTAASREQASMYRQTIAEIDQQLGSARTALRGIDRAIATRQGVPVQPGQPAQPAQPPLPVAPAEPALAPGEWFAEQRAPSFAERTSLPLFLGGGALTLVVLSIAVGLAYARRLRRETAAAIERFHGEMREHLQRLGVGVDAMSVELERIGEGQRFVTKALVEKKEAV
jgi:hypothetical protein